jgi:hypothetical protein
MSYVLNPFTGKLDATGNDLKLDQTTIQSIINGIPLLTSTVDGTGSEYQLVNKEYVDLAVSALELTEFFHNDASDIGGIYYLMDETPDAAGTVVKSGLAAGNNQAMFNFATPTGSPHLDRLVAGVYDCHFHAYKSNVPSKTVTVYFGLYKRTSGGVETLLATSETSAALTTTSTEQNIHCVIATEVTLDVTDRLVIKWYANVVGGGATVNVTMDIGGTENSHFSIRVNPVELNNIFLTLDQTNPQTFTGGIVTGTGLLKVTSGQLGLDTNTYITTYNLDGGDANDVYLITQDIDGGTA